LKTLIYHAVEMAVAGRFNNGQSCIASKRFIAVAAVADEFLKVYKIASLGDPMDPNTGWAT
jgi:succinate-semialdehyde dehydrogenase/glutarate-semialdehyde dehydrogenase